MKKQMAIDSSVVQGVTFQNTYTSLRCLIDNSYYMQIANPPASYSHDRFETSYWHEFCTVRMRTARQSGHTRAMIEIIKEYFDKAFILSPNEGRSEATVLKFRDSIKSPVMVLNHDKITTTSSTYLFGSWGENSMPSRFRGCDTEAIFVDGTVGMSTAKESEICNTLGPCMSNYPQKFFIFVG